MHKGFVLAAADLSLSPGLWALCCVSLPLSCLQAVLSIKS